MRILVTNDDGIHAPGLETLETHRPDTSSDDVWVVAPAEENSGAGHSLSLADPIRYRKIGERRFEVAGTPTDCVVMAVRKILPGMPDLVLSGVNRGQNIADDVTYSGTIAAAMEGHAARPQVHRAVAGDRHPRQRLLLRGGGAVWHRRGEEADGHDLRPWRADERQLSRLPPR